MRMLTALGTFASRLMSSFGRGQPHDAFLPIMDSKGRSVGLMDRMTAEYLQSAAPDPSQASLDDVLAQATRVRVVDWEKMDGGVLQRTRVLTEFTDAESIVRLRDCLLIVEDPATFAHCMCIGEEAIELHSVTGTLATIGLHHGYRIRWDAWKHDALLEDGRRLLSFLDERGLSEPLERYERSLRQAEDAERAAKRWRDAMPSGLEPFWDDMNTLDVDAPRA